MSDQPTTDRTIHLTVTVDSSELRTWADKHAAAGNHGVAHVLYQAAKDTESVSEQAIREAKAEAWGEGFDAGHETASHRLARAAFLVDAKHHFHGTQCLCGFEGDARLRTQTEHITSAVLEEFDAGRERSTHEGEPPNPYRQEARDV